MTTTEYEYGPCPKCGILRPYHLANGECPPVVPPVSEEEVRK